MVKPTERDQKFTTYLAGLREERAALAALRRGLGRPPGAEPQMYPYVEPWLSGARPQWVEQAYYLVASLFAYHPEPGGEGNMGHHFVRLRALAEDNTALERRFVTLLAAHPDDLHRFHLRQTISFLKAKAIPVNWPQLLADLRGWGHPERYIQHSWARSFWGGTGGNEKEK